MTPHKWLYIPDLTRELQEWTRNGTCVHKFYSFIVFKEEVLFNGHKHAFFITSSSGKMSPSMDWRFGHKHAFSSHQTSSSGQMSPSMDWRFGHMHAFSLHHLQGRCHLRWTEDFVTSTLFHHIIFREDVTLNGLKMIRSQACFFITSDISRVRKKKNEPQVSVPTRTFLLLAIPIRVQVSADVNAVFSPQKSTGVNCTESGLDPHSKTRWHSPSNFCAWASTHTNVCMQAHTHARTHTQHIYHQNFCQSSILAQEERKKKCPWGSKTNVFQQGNRDEGDKCWEIKLLFK